MYKRLTSFFTASQTEDNKNYVVYGSPEQIAQFQRTLNSAKHIEYIATPSVTSWNGSLQFEGKDWITLSNANVLLILGTDKESLKHQYNTLMQAANLPRSVQGSFIRVPGLNGSWMSPAPAVNRHLTNRPLANRSSANDVDEVNNVNANWSNTDAVFEKASKRALTLNCIGPILDSMIDNSIAQETKEALVAQRLFTHAPRKIADVATALADATVKQSILAL